MTKLRIAFSRWHPSRDQFYNLQILLYLLLIIITVTGVVWIRHRNLRKLPPDVILKDCIAHIESGDLIFRRTQSIEGNIAVLLGNGDYSHVGIISVDNQGVFVIHVVPSFPSLVRQDTLLEFISDSVAFAVYRVNTSHERREIATSFAKAWTGNKSFDIDFDLKDDNKLYCTELVYNAYRKAGLDLVDGKYDIAKFPIVGRKEVIFPRTIINSGHVEVICRYRTRKYK